MKKKIILLPLLALMLTACDLSQLMPNGGGNNEPAESAERSSLSPNDIAIKVADFVSVFPEVGDELDMSDYISFDTGTNYRLEQFTFESTVPEVISVSNYHARCLKKGYASIKVSGPGLNRPVEISFYVGSIAGTYRMDSSSFRDAIKLEIIEGTEGYSFTLDVVNNGKKFNKRDIVDYNGGGSLLKNISPFLPMDFDGAAPSSFEPIGSFLIDLIGEQNLNQFKDLTDDVYGFMAADPTEGVIIKVRFNESFVDLIAQ